MYYICINVISFPYKAFPNKNAIETLYNNESIHYL